MAKKTDGKQRVKNRGTKQRIENEIKRESDIKSFSNWISTNPISNPAMPTCNVNPG